MISYLKEKADSTGTAVGCTWNVLSYQKAGPLEDSYVHVKELGSLHGEPGI